MYTALGDPMKKKGIIILVLVIFLTVATNNFQIQSKEEASIVTTSKDGRNLYPILTLDEFASPTQTYKVQSTGYIVFDIGHDQYFDNEKLGTYISLLSVFGQVIINSDEITEADLSGASLLVIPNPETQFTQEELDAINNFLNSGGSLIALGNYHAYFYPEILNNITKTYGLYWMDASVRDPTNNSGREYYPIISVWPSNDFTDEMNITKYVTTAWFSGTYLKLIPPEHPENISRGPYEIAVGDLDTYAQFENGTNTTDIGADIIFIAGVELKSGARILAAGSSDMFSDRYSHIYEEDNIVLAAITIGWCLNKTPTESLVPVITSIDASKETFMPNDVGQINVTILNLADEPRENISLAVNVPYFLNVINDQVTLISDSTEETKSFMVGEPLEIGTMAGRQQITVVFNVNCTLGISSESQFYVELIYNEQILFSKSLTLSSRPAFTISSAFDTVFLNLTITNQSVLTVNITNDASYTLYNVNVTLKSVPSGIIFDSMIKTINTISPGDTGQVTFDAEVSEIGAYSIAVEVNAGYYGIGVSRVNLVATTQRIIIFDEGHYQYVAFTSDGMAGFVDVLREFAPVLINKGTFKESLFTPLITALVVIPNPQPQSGSPSDTTGTIFTSEEISYIQNYVEAGGSLLLTGNWYSYFWPDNPGGFNELTNRYGIFWYDGDVYDPVNNLGPTYAVDTSVFGNNSIAKLMSAGVESVGFAGTALDTISSEVTVEHYEILLGNNETYLTLGTSSDPKIKEGKDVVMIMATIVEDKGRIVSSGGTYSFSDTYYFAQNTAFIRNILSWLLKAKKLDILVEGIPYEINVGDRIEAKITITNRGVDSIFNIRINVTTSYGLVNLNATSTFLILELAPGESKTVTWLFKANSKGTYNIYLNVNAANYPETISQIYVVNYVTPTGRLPIETIVVIGIFAVIVGAVFFLYRKAKIASG